MVTGQQIHDMLAGMSKRMQEQRSTEQMTLGGLIAALEAMPSDATVANICNSHSYRGYYDDLAFEREEGTRPASELLAEARAAMGQTFEGYKGGDFVMHARTPLWIASYGDCGKALVAIGSDGSITTKDEE